MSKRCPDCGSMNEDSRIYCSFCGEPLSAELRLIKDLEAKKTAPSKASSSEKPDSKPAARRAAAGDDDEEIQKVSREEKSSPLPWIILGVIVAAAILAVMFLK